MTSIRSLDPVFLERANRAAVALGEPPVHFRQTTLYRYFDSDGGLLYVGVAVNIDRREAQHRRAAWWWSRVARRVDETISEWGCLVVEAAAILAERPLANKVGNLKTARRRAGMDPRT